MNVIDFGRKVLEHPRLDLVDVRDVRDGPGGGTEVLIRVRGPAGEVGPAHGIPLDSVRRNAWEDLEAVLLGLRERTILKTFSRIIGYYSRIENWNRSKLSELADRGRGQYAPPERTEIAREHVPAVVVEELARSGAEMSCRAGRPGPSTRE